MSDTRWKEFRGFDGWKEYDQFVVWLEMQIQLGMAREIAPARPYYKTGMQQKWFVHSVSGVRWRLIKPEPPFAGVFEPVPVDDES